jgi:cytosine/adenosine deaminase-related metal-dependent hydrolase
MATGKLETDIVRDSILTIRGGEIESITTLKSVPLEDLKAQGIVIDAAGGFVLPGFIDVHAHWNGFSSPFPAKSWELETFLAYGVTTVHNPSADNVDAFTERSRVEAGYMVGPRIFSVGAVVYNSADSEVYQDATDLEEARSVLRRIKAEGGEYAISYKNYNIPSR